MTYFRDAYQKFLASPRNAPLAADASLFYVASSTKFEGADAVTTHVSRHSSAVKKSEQTINVIESSDSLVLDQETTLEFVDGGGVYLPSLDDSFITNNIVTIPTLHIVHFNAQGEIQQVRIYWDQGVLLKVVGVIGKRNWPLGDPKEQVRLLKGAATAKSNPPPLAPSHNASRELPARPGSPGKRHIKDPYAADSLYDLLSPSKEDAANGRDEPPRPSSPGKRHLKDPYSADSLTELLSPSKGGNDSVVHPYAPSSKQPTRRDYGDIFVDEDAPPTPSKSERPIAPKAGSKIGTDRIFNNETTEGQERVAYKPNPRRFDHFEIGDSNDTNEGHERVAYKPNPRRFDHFEIADNSDINEGQERVAYKPNPRRFDHFEIGGDDNELKSITPQKSARLSTTEQRQFIYGADDANVETPPARPHVPKPRRDAEVHFEMSDESLNDDGGRIISSFQNRGQSLYQNRLFDDEDATPTEKEDKEAALSAVGQNANRKKDFDSHWHLDESPEHKKPDTENVKTIPYHRSQAAKMLESQWKYSSDSPEPVRTSTLQRDPSRHNQPSWSHGNQD